MHVLVARKTTAPPEDHGARGAFEKGQDRRDPAHLHKSVLLCVRSRRRSCLVQDLSLHPCRIGLKLCSSRD